MSKSHLLWLGAIVLLVVFASNPVGCATGAIQVPSLTIERVVADAKATIAWDNNTAIDIQHHNEQDAANIQRTQAEARKAKAEAEQALADARTANSQSNIYDIVAMACVAPLIIVALAVVAILFGMARGMRNMEPQP